MANVIRILYSADTPIPEALFAGEIAWSKATRRLYIGEDDGSISTVSMPLDPADIAAIAAEIEVFHGHFSVLNGEQPALDFLMSGFDASSLATWINVPANQVQFRTLLHLPVFVNAICDDLPRLALLAANSIAASFLIGSSDCFNILSKNQPAMGVIWAQNLTTDFIWTSSLAKLAVWQSDAAIAALQATPTQIQRKIAAGVVSIASTSAATMTFVPLGRKVILLRRYVSNSSANEWLTWGREGVGDALLPTGLFLNSGSSAAKGRTATYANSGTSPYGSNDNANCVCATNGLARGGANVSCTLTVEYITV